MLHVVATSGSLKLLDTNEYLSYFGDSEINSVASEEGDIGLDTEKGVSSVRAITRKQRRQGHIPYSL